MTICSTIVSQTMLSKIRDVGFNDDIFTTLVLYVTQNVTEKKQ